MGAVAAAAAGTALPAATVAAAPVKPGPALLTISGAIGRANRGGFDRTRDLMFNQHKVSFSTARTFDFAALLALPAVSIAPTLEYDGQAHTLRGPLLTDVLDAAGVRASATAQLVLRAVDGYAASLSLAQAQAQRFIVATHMDGQPMALGGLGPLWAVIDADRLPDVAARPLAARFAGCPWALYHIGVTA